MNLRNLLSYPPIFNAFNLIIGSRRARTLLVRDHIRAKDGDKMFDAGCGTAEILHYLPEVQYFGYDMSQAYIDNAKATHGNRGTFIQKLVTKDAITEPNSFDLGMAIGVLHHLPDAEAIALFESAYYALKPGGRFITLDGCYLEGQSAAARYLISRDRGEHVRPKDDYITLAKQIFSDVRPVVRTDLMRIPYTHIILECVKPL